MIEYEYLLEVVNNKKQLSDKGSNLVPSKFREQVSALYVTYRRDDKFRSFVLDKVLNILGKQFAEKRDAIRWINGYGFDCKVEDITNFLGAYIALQNEYAAWDKTGAEPTTKYKVYIDRNDLSRKDVVELTYGEMNKVYSLVRDSQFAAYEELKTSQKELEHKSVDELIGILNQPSEGE